MKIKAIIVDVGGVLVRTMHTDKRRVWEGKLGLTRGELTKEVFAVEPADRATLGLVTHESIWENVRRKYGLNKEDLELLREDFYAGEELNTDFYSFIKKIRLGYKTAILSNAWDDARAIYTDRYHLDEIVDSMIISAEEGMIKPNENIFKLALDRLDVLPHETIFVDDTILNTAAAGGLGMHTVLFRDTKLAIREINSLLDQLT